MDNENTATERSKKMTQTSLFNTDRAASKPAAPKFKRTTRSSSHIKFVDGQGWVTDYDKARRHWDRGEHTVTDGVVRWNSNSRVPPQDILEDWAELGLPFDIEASAAARDAELADFLADYRANPPEPTREEMFEMQAAFGKGATVVNAITGRRIRL